MNKRSLRLLSGLISLAFLAALLRAGEMAGGTYRITRDEVNASGEILGNASYVLTGSVGAVDTRLGTAGSMKGLSGLQGIYYYPNAITNVTPVPDPTPAASPNILQVTWAAPRGVLPALDLGMDSNYPAASSYIVKYSSVTPLTTQAAFAAAATAPQSLTPGTPGTPQGPLTINGLTANTSYFISIESLDGAAQTGRNPSYPSNSTAAFTLCNVPDGLDFLGFTSSSILLGWNTRNERPGTMVTYEAQRASSLTPVTVAQTVPVNSNSTAQASYNFTGLGQGVDHYFRVRAFNGAGIPSAWTAWISTQIAVGLPDAFAFTNQTVGGFTANWGPGSNAVGQGVMYQVRAADNIAFNNEMLLPASPGADVFGSTFTTANFPAIAPNTTYYARVQAFPQGWPGNGSNPSAFAYLGWTMTNVHRGTSGTYDAHVTSATFTWNPPALSNGPNPFNYRVEMSTASDYSGAISSVTVDSGQLTAVVSNLIPNTIYYARLVTLNGILIPSAEGPSPFPPNATKPVDPIALGFTYVDDYQVEMAWNPNGNNPDLSQYQVELTSDAAGDFSAFPPITAVTIRGTETYRFNVPLQLLANTTYFGRVMVLGDSGFNSNYAVFGATVTRPTTPSVMTFTGMSTSGMTVNWQAENASGLARNAPDTSYLVDILNAPNGAAVQAPQTVMGLSAAFSSLAFNTTYYYRVTALSKSAWPNPAPLTGARATLADTPSLPGGFSNVTDSSMTVTWSRGGNPLGVGVRYRAEISTEPSFTPLWAFGGGVDTFSIDFLGLNANTTYYARVWGVNHSGDLSVLPLDLGAIATNVRQPIMTSNFDTTPTSITVRWNANSNGPSTRYELADWGNVVDSNIFTTTYTHTPLLVNSSHSYTVRAYNISGNPTSYSNAASTWTLASVPPPMVFNGNTPITIYWGMNPNDDLVAPNPTGQPGRADTEFAIQAFYVNPNDTPALQGLYLNQDLGGGTYVLNGTDTTPGIWKTFSQWNNGVIVSSGLATGRTYRFVVYARNGAGIRTVNSIPATGLTRSGIPTLYLNGTLIDGRTSNNAATLVWTNTMDPQIIARGAFNYNFEFLKDDNVGTITDLPATQHVNVAYPGWNGQIGGTILSNAIPDPDGAGPLRVYDSTQPLAGFHATQEGAWYLHVVGDPYAPDYGLTDHTDPSQVYLARNPFRINIDVTAPAAPPNLRAYRRATDAPPNVPATPLPMGRQVGWDEPYFNWQDPDNAPADPTRVSPTVGYSYVFTTNAGAQPLMSTDTTRNTDIDGYSEGFMARTGQYDGHQTALLTAANTYYFMVRSLDRAGNWGAIQTYVYDVVPDRTPPVPVVDFGPSVRVLGSDTTVAVSTAGVIKVYFTDDMDPVLTGPGAFDLRLLRSNENIDMGAPGVGAPVSIGVTYEGPPLTSTPTVTITPVGGLQPGRLYRLLSTTNLQDDSGNVVDPPIDEYFRTLMSPLERNVVANDISTSPVSMVTFEPGTWGGSVLAGLAVNMDPSNNPLASPALPGLISKANNSHDGNSHGYGTPLAIHEFNLYDSQALRLSGQFNRPAAIQMRFNDMTGPNGVPDGIVDETQQGSGRPIRVSSLGIYSLNEETGVWSRLPSSIIDPAAGVVRARLYHFSVYALMGSPESALADAYAYPVPYKPALHTNGIVFANLSDFGTIKIFTINGDLVKTLNFEQTNAGEVTWNPVTNDAGDPLASDVYIYLIESDQQKKTGKILVVR